MPPRPRLRPKSTLSEPGGIRAFQTSSFSKAAKKRHLSEQELCNALAEVIAGKADDLGGGVYKKRLNANLDRSIILAKGGRHWIFAYLFQKSSRANIDERELSAYRQLANFYALMTDVQFDELVYLKKLLEICKDCRPSE
jgi:hypothetical protein